MLSCVEKVSEDLLALLNYLPLLEYDSIIERGNISDLQILHDDVNGPRENTGDNGPYKKVVSGNV